MNSKSYAICYDDWPNYDLISLCLVFVQICELFRYFLDFSSYSIGQIQLIISFNIIIKYILTHLTIHFVEASYLRPFLVDCELYYSDYFKSIVYIQRVLERLF